MPKPHHLVDDDPAEPVGLFTRVRACLAPMPLAGLSILVFYSGHWIRASECTHAKKCKWTKLAAVLSLLCSIVKRPITCLPCTDCCRLHGSQAIKCIIVLHLNTLVLLIRYKHLYQVNTNKCQPATLVELERTGEHKLNKGVLNNAAQ